MFSRIEAGRRLRLLILTHPASFSQNRQPMRTVSRLLTVALLHGAASAQQASPEDVTSIDGIMKAYCEVVSGPAGEKADMERDRSLHHPDAWVAIAGVDEEGTPSDPPAWNGTPGASLEPLLQVGEHELTVV